MRTFEELLAEGAAVPTDGWDFSWFAGRATEQRPPWGYARRLAAAMAATTELPGGGACLDLQTGGGEVLASTGVRVGRLVATESWPPNVDVAGRRLATLGGTVVQLADAAADLPFEAASFDLVTSRHPVTVRWDEVARVLRPGGRYLSQEVGFGSMRELTEAMMGPVYGDGDGTGKPSRHPIWSVRAAEAAGLVVDELRTATLEAVFLDIAAVVHFLRKVIWIVPDFTVPRYHDQLRAVHDTIQRQGRFVAHSQRFLIAAHRPA